MDASEQILAEVKRIRADYEKRRSSLQFSCHSFEHDVFMDAQDFQGYVTYVFDEAMSTFQLLLMELDAECRPLLNKKPSAHAVREVRDLLRSLKDSLYEEGYFSGKTWEDSQRQRAKVSYRPSMECRTIVRYWETYYEKMPEAAAEELARKKKIEDDKKERERKAQEEIRKKKEAEEKERAAIAPRIEKKKRELKKELEAARKEQNQIQTQIEAMLASQEKRQAELQAELMGLGFFSFKEKKELRKKLDELQHQGNIDHAVLKGKHDDLRKKIAELDRNLTLLGASAKCKVEFGRNFFNVDEPMRWLVISSEGREIKLLAEHTVQMNGYLSAIEWMNGAFLNRSFSKVQRDAMKTVARDGISEKVVHPKEEELCACCYDYTVTVDAALAACIREEVTQKGMQVRDSSEQIERKIKDELNSAKSYWISTSRYSSASSANYVDRVNASTKMVNKLGSGVKIGVRPVIHLDIEALLKAM